jgi:hypothetical protein
MQSIESQPVSWRNMFTSDRGAAACYLLHAGFLRGSFFDPKEGGDMSSKMLIDFQWTTWCYIPEDGNFHNHRENLKSYLINLMDCTRLNVHNKYNILFCGLVYDAVSS